MIFYSVLNNFIQVNNSINEVINLECLDPKDCTHVVQFLADHLNLNK